MKRKIGLFLSLFLLLALALPFTVFADMGPKPRVAVRVENLPEGDCYVDLLIEKSGDYENITEQNRSALNPDMLAVLENYSGEYGYPALTCGTNIPLFGRLPGEADGNDRLYTFSYFGVPDEFRLIAVTEDLQLKVSEPIRKDVLQIHVAWDFQSNKVTQPSTFPAYLIQLLGTLLPTLLIEGVILLLFRFSLKQNWLPFLITNLVTQLGLFLIIGIPTVRSGYLAYYFTFFPAELVILVVECLVYVYFLKGRGKGWRIAYAITANAVSCAAGFFLAQPLFQLITRIL